MAARDKPLFESLKDLPSASLTVPSALDATASVNKAKATLMITNRNKYARLVRVRAEWQGGEGGSPFLVTYSDNFFDLMPGESKPVAMEMFLPKEHMGRLSGTFVVDRKSTRL